MWFKNLTGIEESGPEEVRSRLLLEGTRLTSAVNQRSWECGRLDIPSLKELREQLQQVERPKGRLQIEEVVGDAQALHKEPENRGALFQVASQFNLLEMLSPSVSPEAGIDIYENDPTQGPACAIAAGAGTIYRNYFVEIDGQLGQTRQRQIDCLYDMGRSLGNDQQQLWRMQNGYALPSPTGLERVRQKIEQLNEAERDRLRQLLRIGIQWNTQVTLEDCKHTVNQVYCSALPVAYSSLPPDRWEAFARLVLEAAYEAVLSTALLNLTQNGHPKVFLTLLGGGAFGNPDEWIMDALKRALFLFSDHPLEVAIVSYRQSNPKVLELITNLQG